MNLDNRRLKEIQSELKAYYQLLDECVKETDRQMYQGKINALEREEKQILKRYDVVII